MTLPEILKGTENISEHLDKIFNDLGKKDINGLKKFIDKNINQIFSARTQIEYNCSMTESLLSQTIAKIEELKKLKKNKEIEEDTANRQLKKYIIDKRNCFHILALSTKAKKKLELTWEFISWRYNVLLSESMEIMSKTNNKLSIIATIIAAISILIAVVSNIIF